MSLKRDCIVFRDDVTFWTFPAAPDLIPLKNTTTYGAAVSCNYYVSFCRPMNLTTSGNRNCLNVGGCLKCEYYDESETLIFVLRSLGRHDISTVATGRNEIRFFYPDGDDLNDRCKLYTTIKLGCDTEQNWLSNSEKPTGPKPTHQYFNSTDCRLTVSIPFSGACQTSTKITRRKLPTSSLLMIIFFIGLILYFIMGLTYNFAKGPYAKR
ncbi:Uncharacterised protein g2349 [Pycnogonum litorale]